MFDSLFDEWPPSEGSPTRMWVRPPQPVWLQPAGALGVHLGSRHWGKSRRAISLQGPVPALLYAWAYTEIGAWIGFCAWELPTVNGQGRVRFAQWVPSTALVPRGDPDSSI